MIEFLKMEFHEDELVKNAAGREILEYMGFVEEEGASAFAAIRSGCASVMIDDGESMVFTYPVSISEDADEADIIKEIIRFCSDCEIAPIFIDTPRDSLPVLLEGVRHADIDGDGIAVVPPGGNIVGVKIARVVAGPFFYNGSTDLADLTAPPAVDAVVEQTAEEERRARLVDRYLSVQNAENLLQANARRRNIRKAALVKRMRFILILIPIIVNTFCLTM
jgi:hypothetical protein